MGAPPGAMQIIITFYGWDRCRPWTSLAFWHVCSVIMDVIRCCMDALFPNRSRSWEPLGFLAWRLCLQTALDHGRH